MKKLGIILGSVLLITSCTTNTTSQNNNTNGGGTLDTITRIAQISSTISEISNLLGGLNLTPSQNSLVKEALTTYVKNYSGLNAGQANYSNLLNKYKTETINDLKDGLGVNKYNEVFNVIKTVTKDETQKQTTTNSPVNDVVTQALLNLIK